MEYCKSNNIILQAYSSLGIGKVSYMLPKAMKNPLK
jgi:diketogulonate reductase-like aldo/keto reductase